MRKIAAPLKWLFTKPIRWLSAILILILLVPIFFIGSCMVYLTYQHVNNEIGEIRYKIEVSKDVKQLRKDLEISEALWESKNVTDYYFDLEISTGARDYWEGFGGISNGPELVAKIHCTVDKEGIHTIDAVSGNAVLTSHYDDCNSVARLYDLIKNNIDAINEGEIYLPEYVRESGQSFSVGYVNTGIKVEFSRLYGFPKVVALYTETGSPYGSFYARYFYAIFEITEFLDLNYH